MRAFFCLDGNFAGGPVRAFRGRVYLVLLRYVVRVDHRVLHHRSGTRKRAPKGKPYLLVVHGLRHTSRYGYHMIGHRNHNLLCTYYSCYSTPRPGTDSSCVLVIFLLRCLKCSGMFLLPYKAHNLKCF